MKTTTKRCPKCGTAMENYLIDEKRKLHVCGNNPDCDGYVVEQVSGFIGLRSGAAMFIRPDGVALYASSLDALHNRDCQWVIPFPPLNS